jgi:hypothetical protein
MPNLPTISIFFHQQRSGAKEHFSQIVYVTGRWVFDTVNNYGCSLVSLSLNPGCDIQVVTGCSHNPEFHHLGRPY